MKKYEILDGKPFLLVPILHERNTGQPLRYSSRLVYAYLLYRLAKGHGATCPHLATRLGIDRETARRAVGVLARHGLAERRGRTWMALEPVGAAKDYFRWQNDPSGDWSKSFVYDKVFFPTDKCPFGPRANEMLWRLVKNAVPVADMRHRLFIQKPAFLTIKYLARGLHCDQKTATRSLRELQKAGVIHVVHSGSRQKGFQVGITLAPAMKDWWRNDLEKNLAVPLTARQLFGIPSTLPIEEDIKAQGYVIKELIRRGIPSRLAETITAMLETHLIPPREWRPMLDKVESDHGANRETRPDDFPPDCGKLMLYELKRHIRHRLAIDERASRCCPQDVEEMNGKAAVQRIKGSARLIYLLRHIISSERILLDDDSEVPIRLDWSSVESSLRDSLWDKEQFKSAILNRVFGSDEPVACTWYRQWLEA